ncbi:MAG TPA: class II aldolase/adducin family protein [Methanomassiliicoccales archaeon]|nr:class II aldolase/adducin family protein [Methanomassiliicoccales archaeon]
MKQAGMDVVRYGRLLYEKGLTSGTGGNISARVGDLMVITPSGSCKGMLDQNELVTVDIVTGRAVSGRPSMETPFHLTVYRNRPDVNGVVHVHPRFCTVLACAGTPVDPALTPEGLMVLGKRVPLIPYATPGTDDLAVMLGREVEGADAFLLESHGAIAVGKGLKDAFHRMETLEAHAELQYRLALLGKGRPLPEDEVRRILRE